VKFFVQLLSWETKMDASINSMIKKAVEVVIYHEHEGFSETLCVILNLQREYEFQSRSPMSVTWWNNHRKFSLQDLSSRFGFDFDMIDELIKLSENLAHNFDNPENRIQVDVGNDDESGIPF
jgi:hypothetical protein